MSSKDWQLTILDNEVDLLTGFPFKSAKYSDVEDDILLLRGDNVVQGRLRWDGARRWPQTDTANVEDYFLKMGDVVLAMDRPWIEAGLKYASISKYDVPCLLVQRVARLRARGTLDQRYLRYLIGSQQFTDYVLGIQTGTAVPHISGGQIKAFRFLRPPLPEQRAIAHILGTLDDKIELNRRMNQTLEALARAIFTSWFVDFAPVRAKAEGRQPEGMDAETAALFPGEMESSDWGETPKEWDVSAISQLAKVNDLTLRSSDRIDQINYIEISAVKCGDVNEITPFTRGSEPSRARRRLRHGDTVISTVRPDRQAYFLSLWPAENLIASTGFAVFTPYSVPWSFIHSALTQRGVFVELGRLADGGAYPAVNPDRIGDLKVALPRDTRILDAYHKLAAPLYEKSARNRAESYTLAATRDLLLPKLLSGEVRVPDAERLVQAAS